VAIKFLPTRDAGGTQRLLDEARATARCGHENIAAIQEVGEHEGVPFLVMEYLLGQPLKALTHQQRLPAVRAIELMVPVVKALACAHAQGIVHHDLTPENIVVTDSGGIKVLDFGLAQVLQPGGSWAPASRETPSGGGLLDDEG
jgi:serine/threonine protein kinase